MHEIPDATAIQCCAVAGSGDLVSKIWRLIRDDGTTAHVFTIGLAEPDAPVGLNLFQPTDLLPMLRLLRVIAQELVHDGAAGQNIRDLLQEIAEALDLTVESLNSATPVRLFSAEEAAALASVLRESRNCICGVMAETTELQAHREILSKYLRTHFAGTELHIESQNDLEGHNDRADG